MIKVESQNPYALFRAYAQCRKKLEATKRYEQNLEVKLVSLQTTLCTSKDTLAQLPERLQSVASELRALHQKKLQGRTIHYHRLTDCWSSKQIREYHTLLDIIQYPNRDYYGRGELAHDPLSVDAVEAGIVWKRGADLFVTPNIRKRLQNLALAATASAGFFGITGFFYTSYEASSQPPYYASIDVDFMNGILFGVEVGLMTACIIGLPITLAPKKNPFTSVADTLDEHTAYLQQNHSLLETL